jgi:hypothetical protein
MIGTMKTEEPNTYLSKSLFIRGLQCHKALYLQKNHPEWKDEISESQETLFRVGTDVGILARELFPGGTEVPYEGLPKQAQLDLTQSLIKEGKTTLYEATFIYDGVFVKADILHKGTDGWEIYEVKASAAVKPQHVDDVAVQYYVAAGSGLTVSRASLVCINSKYTRRGDVSVAELFKIEDKTEIVREKQAFVAEEIVKQQSMLRGIEPAIDIGPHCDAPYRCDFKGHCWSHIPAPSVFDYADRGKPNGFTLYRQGIVRMEDVSPDILGWRQKLQLDGFLHQRNNVDVQAIREFVDSLWYPLCFFDFETTFMNPVPLFDDMRPYQKVPFQYSLDVIQSPGEAPTHYEFLADGRENPQREILYRLLAEIPPEACILTWHQAFEIGRLKELAAAYPEKSANIQTLIGNVRDLMAPFRDKSMYHWKFDGLYTLKVVLPALIPELTYDVLEISDGGMAADAWIRMIQTNDDGEKAMIRRQLLQYCNLDTLAMVRILEKMKEYAGY